MTRTVVIDGVYRHFKGNIYQVIAIGKDVDSLKEKVIYQSLDDKEKVWVRDLDEFLSEVDHQKYPNVLQKYRFEYIEDSQ